MDLRVNDGRCPYRTPDTCQGLEIGVPHAGPAGVPRERSDRWAGKPDPIQEMGHRPAGDFVGCKQPHSCHFIQATQFQTVLGLFDDQYMGSRLHCRVLLCSHSCILLSCQRLFFAKGNYFFWALLGLGSGSWAFDTFTTKPTKK